MYMDGVVVREVKGSGSAKEWGWVGGSLFTDDAVLVVDSEEK